MPAKNETAMNAISAALCARGMLPLDGMCSCACCGVTGMDREEMATSGTHKASYLRAVEEMHNGRVCLDCMDSHEFCDGCGEIAASLTDGRCDTCRDDDELDARHVRQEKHGWEQV